ncbi:hypothetical protein G4B88_005519 [Cannabis sativa]|uniref:PHD finger protein ALFIN-LIKE n=1 Tax=Cannabis sativa TaxID=3483 RepID=A0A7J6HA14_CANSA|nr:hypothetical protein G4B88_005519 [Cannabis sativa]
MPASLLKNFRGKNLKTRVIGCPKTIDGDLKCKEVPTNFGFDTACKLRMTILDSEDMEKVRGRSKLINIRMGWDEEHFEHEATKQIAFYFLMTLSSRCIRSNERQYEKKKRRDAYDSKKLRKIVFNGFSFSSVSSNLPSNIISPSVVTLIDIVTVDKSVASSLPSKIISPSVVTLKDVVTTVDILPSAPDCCFCHAKGFIVNQKLLFYSIILDHNLLFLSEDNIPSWESSSPNVSKVLPKLFELALGVNFARDWMQEKGWLSLVAVHSNSWLLAIAFYFGARFGFGKSESSAKCLHSYQATKIDNTVLSCGARKLRESCMSCTNQLKRLFQMINDLPTTIFEVLTGSVIKQSKEQSTTCVKVGIKMSPPPKDENESSEEEEEDDKQGVTCGASLDEVLYHVNIQVI